MLALLLLIIGSKYRKGDKNYFISNINLKNLDVPPSPPDNSSSSVEPSTSEGKSLCLAK